MTVLASITISAVSAEGVAKLGALLIHAAEDEHLFVGSTPAKDEEFPKHLKKHKSKAAPEPVEEEEQAEETEEEQVEEEKPLPPPSAKKGPGRPKTTPAKEASSGPEITKPAKITYASLKNIAAELKKFPGGNDKGKEIIEEFDAESFSSLDEELYEKVYDKFVAAIKAASKKK